MDVLHEAMFGGPFDTPIERARAILPERADRHRQAARVMDQLGLVEESETLFRRALSMEPSGVHFYAQALLSWGRPGDALMLLQAERQGCSGERMYSQALLQLDRVEEAVGAFTQALRLCGASDWTLRAWPREGTPPLGGHAGRGCGQAAARGASRRPWPPTGVALGTVAPR